MTTSNVIRDFSQGGSLVCCLPLYFFLPCIQLVYSGNKGNFYLLNLVVIVEVGCMLYQTWQGTPGKWDSENGRRLTVPFSWIDDNQYFLLLLTRYRKKLNSQRKSLPDVNHDIPAVIKSNYRSDGSDASCLTSADSNSSTTKCAQWSEATESQITSVEITFHRSLG